MLIKACDLTLEVVLEMGEATADQADRTEMNDGRPCPGRAEEVAIDTTMLLKASYGRSQRDVTVHGLHIL